MKCNFTYSDAQPFNPNPPPSRPMIEITPEDVTLSPGDSVRLSCYVRGSDFTLSWTRQEGRELPQTARVQEDGALLVFDSVQVCVNSLIMEKVCKFIKSQGK